MALAVVASACSSAPPANNLSFEVLANTTQPGPRSDLPKEATASDSEDDFAALWAEVEAGPTAALDGRIGIVANISPLYRNPEIRFVSGIDIWTIEVSANNISDCSGVDVLISPVVAIAVDADSAPDRVDIDIARRSGCDGG